MIEGDGLDRFVMVLSPDQQACLPARGPIKSVCSRSARLADMRSASQKLGAADLERQEGSWSLQVEKAALSAFKLDKPSIPDSTQP